MADKSPENTSAYSSSPSPIKNPLNQRSKPSLRIQIEQSNTSKANISKEKQGIFTHDQSNFVKQINITSSFGQNNKQDQSNQISNEYDEMEYEPINISSAKNIVSFLRQPQKSKQGLKSSQQLRNSKGKFTMHSINSDSSKLLLRKPGSRPAKPRNPIKRDRIPQELTKQGNLSSILGVNTKTLTKQISSLKREFQTYGPKDPFNLNFKEVQASQEDKQIENPHIRPNFQLKTPDLSASAMNPQPSQSTFITEHNPKPIFTNI